MTVFMSGSGLRRTARPEVADDGHQLPPASADAYTCPPVVPKYTPHESAPTSGHRHRNVGSAARTSRWTATHIADPDQREIREVVDLPARKVGPLTSHRSWWESDVRTNAPVRVPTSTRTPRIRTPYLGFSSVVEGSSVTVGDQLAVTITGMTTVVAHTHRSPVENLP
jgi:hypothetical protein